MTRTEDPSAGFALLRALALYLVSVLTAMAALVAWPWAASLATALLVAPAAAGAPVAGELAAPSVAAAQPPWPPRGGLRDRVRAMIAIAVSWRRRCPSRLFGRKPSSPPSSPRSC